MKSLKNLLFSLTMALGTLFLPSAAMAGANAIPGGTNNAACANSNAVAVLSIFDLSAKSTKDPFFPLSTRSPLPAVTNSAPAFSVAEFTLKGLSGPARNRLALINNRTFAEGEENDLVTASGKIKVRCIEIKENSVVVRVGSQRETMEIFLRKSAQ